MNVPVDAYWPEYRLVVEYREVQHDHPFFDKPARRTSPPPFATRSSCRVHHCGMRVPDPVRRLLRVDVYEVGEDGQVRQW